MPTAEAAVDELGVSAKTNVAIKPIAQGSVRSAKGMPMAVGECGVHLRSVRDIQTVGTSCA